MTTKGVSQVGLLGSYARNAPSDKSDIDILVDVVTKNGLSPYIGPSILEQVEYV
jgi:uncharacterized protein